MYMSLDTRNYSSTEELSDAMTAYHREQCADILLDQANRINNAKNIININSGSTLDLLIQKLDPDDIYGHVLVLEQAARIIASSARIIKRMCQLIPREDNNESKTSNQVS